MIKNTTILQRLLRENGAYIASGGHDYLILPDETDNLAQSRLVDHEAFTILRRTGVIEYTTTPQRFEGASTDMNFVLSANKRLGDLKTPQQLNKLTDEPKLLRAVADLIEAGRSLYPSQVEIKYIVADRWGKITGACDMGCLYMASGYLRRFDASHPLQRGYSYHTILTAAPDVASMWRYHWIENYWTLYGWRGRSIKRLGGNNLYQFVTGNNDMGIPTAETVRELRESAQ